MKIKPAIFALIFSTALFSTNLYAEKESFSQNRLGLNSNSKLVVAKDNIRYGLASYYSEKFHGRITASGERFNMYKLTAASNTYKFGTLLRVTCTTTNKSVVVRVNDTGSFTRKYGREIDLSYAAAKAIGMLDKGITKVKIEEIK
jgi:rare lipoprotein A